MTEKANTLIDVTYKDEHFLAINKASGLLSVPGKAESPNLYDQVRAKFPNAQIVHRLDMSTSGLILFAQSKACQAALGKLFETRQISKRYSAVIDGILEQDFGEIELPLICDWPNRPRQHVNWHSGKASHTRYTVTSRDLERNRTNIKLYPVTGRSHQLRVHCQAIGHAILGDNLYAEGRARDASERLLLHAEFLKFKHPYSDTLVEIFLPPEF